jgi:uncharacterized membrane protein YfcA
MTITFLGSKNGAQYGMKYLSEKRLMQIFLAIIIVIAVRYIIDLAGI